MRQFAELFLAIDATNKTNAKVAALQHYFEIAPDKDKVWTIALLSHRRPKRTVNTRLLREWAAEYSGISPWLFEESYHVVGDLAETIALVLPNPISDSKEQALHAWIEQIMDLKDVSEADKKAFILQAWQGMDKAERFVFNKLITGGFRMGVSQKLMVRALGKALDIEENSLQHRIMGNWDPRTITFDELLLQENSLDAASKPYPFYLAYQIDGPVEDLGDPSDWQAEHKWDGIRGQLIKRGEEVFLWSRGEELVTDRFPELKLLATKLPAGCVLDGEILVFKDGQIQNFNLLQTRIGRKTVSKATLQKAPVILKAYDVLEWDGNDIRHLPLLERRAYLAECVAAVNDERLQQSPSVAFSTWEDLKVERSTARSMKSEGLMLKRKDAPYGVGRKKGDWWKWKVDPLTVDAVLIYAMRGHGRRANLYTDYTFAVWKGDELVPFTKAYSGLTDAEFRKVDAFVKKNTIERFGPVRSVKPELVFEIAFEGIAQSSRHKSGVALRFPRMKRWRHDKPVEEANTLNDLLTLL
ncbi:MAG: ATP-dependent DNA ligase [Saprospiraceae bacterium]|nr:ATP-dependent DNA ligase [Saprospiraceae bacterium]